MTGYYLWALVIVGIFVLGGIMAFVTARYSRTHARRSPAEKQASRIVTKENYRDPVAHDQ